jgi:hypothetical protein
MCVINFDMWGGGCSLAAPSLRCAPAQYGCFLLFLNVISRYAAQLLLLLSLLLLLLLLCLFRVYCVCHIPLYLRASFSTATHCTPQHKKLVCQL